MPFSSGLPFLASFLEVLRPSKSPHLVATSIGVVCLGVVSNDEWVGGIARFLCIAIAALVALVLVVVFSFRDRVDVKYKDHADDEIQQDMETQFKFARSMGITSAIIALLLSGILINGRPDYCFYIAWTVAVVQLSTFIVYSSIRLKKEEVESKLNIFEISFMMFVLLLGFVYCLSQLEKEVDSTNQLGPDLRFLFSTISLFFLWFRYELFWVRRIFQIVEVRVR